MKLATKFFEALPNLVYSSKNTVLTPCFQRHSLLMHGNHLGCFEASLALRSKLKLDISSVFTSIFSKLFKSVLGLPKVVSLLVK
jgi:hypothetical protein